MKGVISPNLLTYKSAYVRTETAGILTAGETVCEFHESIMGKILKQKFNAEVALELDVMKFNQLFKERVTGYLKSL
jgi:inosine-uridine nucleoside N-ribohydrolase